MVQMILRVHVIGLLAFSFHCLPHASQCSGQVTLEPSSNTPEIEIVLRVSKAYLESLTRSEVKYSFPIQRNVDGMPVRGHVDANGTSMLEIIPSTEKADFVLSVIGKANSRFTIDAGPAKATASSVTDYTAKKVFSFDGVDYQQNPATTDTTSCTRLRSICPKHRGLIGKLVQKIGRNIAKQNWSDVNREVDTSASKYILEKFEKSAAELITKLDEMSRFDETVDILLDNYPDLNDAEYRLAAQGTSLLAGLGPRSAEFRKFPPTKSTVELWLKTRPAEAAFLQIVIEWDLAHDLLREYLPEAEAKKFAEDLTVEVEDGWTVLRLGSDQPTAGAE